MARHITVHNPLSKCQKRRLVPGEKKKKLEDDNSNIALSMECVFDVEENIVGKEEYAGNKIYFCFPKLFSKEV